VRPVIKEPKELRAELDRVNGEHKSLSQKLVAAEAKLAEAERKGQDTTALTSRITTLEGEIQKRDAELRAARQEASPEWQEQFEKPWKDFAEYAKFQVEQLEVQNSDGSVRQATWDDFGALYVLPLNKAAAVARDMFGDNASLVMNQLNELHRLDWKKQIALKEERDQYKAKNEKDIADHATQQAQHNKLWEDVNRDLTQSVDGYRDDPEDKELVDARAQAHQIIEAPMNDFRSYIIKQAHIKQRAAAYPVLMIKFARQAAKMDALQAELDSLKNPPPPGDTRRGGGAPAPTAPDAFEDYMRKGMSNVQ
jgi:hypothetical protein